VKFFNLRLIAVLALSTILLVGSVGSAFAQEQGRGSNFSRTQRLNEVFSAKVPEMEFDFEQLHPGESISLSVVAIKTLQGFSGSTYTLAELAPSGYIILHDESGLFVEHSARSPSPYAGLDAGLYYAGPTGYYYKDGLEYRHTVITEVFTQADEAGLAVVADELYQSLMQNADVDVADYISGKTATYPAGLRTITYSTYTRINSYPFFTQMSKCGQVSIGNGVCGYIAAAMLLAWKHDVSGDLYYTLGWLTYDNGRAEIDNAFTSFLYSIGVGLGYGTGTTASQIKNVVESYLQAVGRNNVTHHMSQPGTNGGIVGHLNSDRPVLWFGAIINYDQINNSNGKFDPMLHAVTVYGHKSVALIGTSYLAHFGWDGWNEVTFNGVLGGYYTIS